MLTLKSTLVWFLLSLATAISWWLGGHGGQSVASTSTVILGLAFVKAMLVIFFFMEVRHAPLAIRLICVLWCLVVGGALIGLYLGLAAQLHVG